MYDDEMNRTIAVVSVPTLHDEAVDRLVPVTDITDPPGAKTYVGTTAISEPVYTTVVSSPGTSTDSDSMSGYVKVTEVLGLNESMLGPIHKSTVEFV